MTDTLYRCPICKQRETQSHAADVYHRHGPTRRLVQLFPAIQDDPQLQAEEDGTT